MYRISHLRNLAHSIIIILVLFNLLLNISLAEHISASETNKESDSDPVNKENQQDTTLFSDSSTSAIMTSAVVTAASSPATESDDEQSQCSPKISRCPGNRLPSPEDCSCLAMAGEKCGFNTRKRCDQNLGLRCIPEKKSSLTKSYGVCRGQYNVQVVSTGYSNVSLKWDNFKPHDYSYEYVILYRKTFEPDIWLWHSNACGPEPEAVVHGLRVNQGYFFRVTVWKDPVKQLYGNITEAVYAKTKAGCIFQGKTYQVGQLYEVKCEDICKCKPDGKFACEPVCPEERHNPKINNPMFKCTRKLIGQSECCYATVCEPIDMVNCESGNMTFGNGESWNVDCQKRCVCQKGNIRCQPLCQRSKIDLHQCPHPTERYVKGECCPIRECLSKEETCVYKNAIHIKLQPFLSDDCQLCICDKNNDIICHPLRCAPVPEITGMKPTPICPNPQKRKNKCCETIYCHNPLSTNLNAVSNLAAYVKNQRSLIISFTPPFSGQLRKQLIGYEIQHTTQARNGTTTIEWSSEFFNTSSSPKPQTVSPSIDRRFEKQTIKYTDVLGLHFFSKKQQLSLNISTPEDVFVQVNHLQPGTKYYIRIRARIDVERTQNYRHRSSEENAENQNINSRRNNAMLVEELISADKKEQVKRVLTPFSQIISVSTPAKGLGCYTDTRWLSEGETFNRSCSETCTCKNGDVVCKYICPSLKIVYPTDTCPHPQIQTIAGVCCPQWKCNHTKANCKHRNVTLKHGDTIRDGCNEICSCDDGMLVCQKLCHTDAPSVVNGCTQIYMPTHCCPVWICEQEKRPYTSALLSSVLRLKGECSPSDKTINNAVRKSVLDRILSDHSTEPVAPIAFKVKVTCNDSNTSEGNQQKVGQFNLMLHLEWKINLKNTVESVNGTAELWKIVNRTVVALTNSQFRIVVGQSSYGPAVSEGNYALTYLCEVGFLKTESGCVKYENVDTTPNDIDLHFAVSILRRTSCLLKWRQLTNRSQNSTRALYVVHRERATSSANWTWSEALNSTTVHYKLESLLAGRRYEAGLMWLPNIHGAKRFLLTSLHFKTKLKRVTPDNHTTMKIATPLCVIIILLIVGVSIYLIWKRHHQMKKKTETTFYENKGFWIGMMEGQGNSMAS